MDFLNEWPLWKLEALARVAKQHAFFKHPKNMIALRKAIQAKRRECEVVAMPERLAA